jgi:hypothetical protein
MCSDHTTSMVPTCTIEKCVCNRNNTFSLFQVHDLRFFSIILSWVQYHQISYDSISNVLKNSSLALRNCCKWQTTHVCKVNEIRYILYPFIIKGTVSQDFLPSVFFHQSIPPRSLINRENPIRIWLQICRSNRFESRQIGFSNVNDTEWSLQFPNFLLLKVLV